MMARLAVADTCRSRLQAEYAAFFTLAIQEVRPKGPGRIRGSQAGCHELLPRARHALRHHRPLFPRPVDYMGDEIGHSAKGVFATARGFTLIDYFDATLGFH